MEWVHNTFRRALADAPGQIGSVASGDTERAQHLASYFGEILWLLHAHHDGENELLYPLLNERVPESKDLFSRMEGQHAAVLSGVEAAQAAAERFGQSGSPEDGHALASACQSLLAELEGHLTEEEEQVVPIASRTVTPAEWGALPAHVLSHYSGSRLWLVFGLATEMFPDDARAQVLAHVPPPVSAMWFDFGSDAFAKEMAAIRGAGS